MNKGNVYIVHCIDAEGPLYEPIQATFDRIRNIFGYEFEPRRDILQKLQRAEIPLTEKNEKDVAIMLLESRIRNHSSFDQIEEMLDIICSDNFRQHLPDSKGNGWKYNWFCLDHVGFNGLNPRRRIAGYHSIFDFYIDKVKHYPLIGRIVVHLQPKRQHWMPGHLWPAVLQDGIAHQEARWRGGVLQQSIT